MGADIHFRPLCLTDANLIQQSWGSRTDNFTYLTAPVLNNTTSAQEYINQTLMNPVSKAFHIVDGDNIVA